MERAYYIAVDCEGVACAVGKSGVGLGDADNYRFACAQATREADAAAKALFASGATRVLVWDAHGGGVNLDYMALDQRCEIVLGAGHRGRFAGLDESFAAVLFIGYHAMEGTQNAVLAHSYSSKTFQHYRINGTKVGELAIDAAWAGMYKVPVLFCASDDKCVAEARATFGPIACVETKQSLSWTSAISRHPQAVCQDIYGAVLDAAQKGPQVPPFTFAAPLQVELRYQRMDLAAQAALYDEHGKPFGFSDAYTRVGVVASLRDLL